MKSRSARTAHVLLASMCALALVACGQEGRPTSAMRSETEDAADSTAEEAGTDEFVSTAMVVTFGDGEVLFVDQETGTPYYPTNMPSDAPELAAGNIVRVTGNGIMLESYPAQYPGITDVEVIEEGTPADAEKYDELVTQIWQPKDPSEPPLASLEYTTELAATSVMLGTYGYTWSYEENGSEQTVTADAPHPTQLEAAELSDARVDGPTEITVTFDVPCTAAGIVRWPEDELEAAAEAAGSAQAVEIGSVEGDAWTVDDRKIVDGNVVFTVEPGWRYAVEAYFDGGEAVYAFTVR